MIKLAGMIGAGKSTVAGLIGETLGSAVFYESVDANPFLRLFYGDQKRWSFALQIYFLNTRFRAIKQARSRENNVLDRSIWEDQIFASLAYESGNMTVHEYRTYLDLLENMMEHVQPSADGRLDLMVFLSGSLETHLKRIARRGRSYEQAAELTDYYKALYGKYVEWIAHFNRCPVLTVNIDEYDVVERPEDGGQVMFLVKAKLTSLERQSRSRAI